MVTLRLVVTTTDDAACFEDVVFFGLANFAPSSWNLRNRAPKPMHGMFKRLHRTHGGCRPPLHYTKLRIKMRNGKGCSAAQRTFFFCCLQAAQPRLLGTPTILVFFHDVTEIEKVNVRYQG